MEMLPKKYQWMVRDTPTNSLHLCFFGQTFNVELSMPELY